MRMCDVEGCDRKHEGNGLCKMHWQRMDRWGTLNLIKPTPEERFHKSYTIGLIDDCWLWEKSCNELGYGLFSIKGVRHRAHRFSWELKNGPIPEGLFACHHCDTPGCVNPNHLFIGTQKDNIRDAMKKGRIDHRKNGMKGNRSRGKNGRYTAWLEGRE